MYSSPGFLRQKFLSLSCLGIVLLGLGFFFPFSAGADQAVPREITITTGEYAPFNSSTFKYGGFIPRIITEAFRLKGVTAHIKFYPWARAYKLSKAGEVDGTAQWYDSEERRQFHVYSDPIFKETVVWFHLKETKFDWTDLKSLKSLRIGAVHGYTYTKEFYDLIKSGDLQVQFVGDDEQNYKKLLARRIDVVPEVLDVGLYIINRNYPPETAQLYTQHAQPFFSSYTYLLMPRQKKASTTLIALFNEGLKTLRDEGMIEQYLLESREGRYNPD